MNSYYGGSVAALGGASFSERCHDFGKNQMYGSRLILAAGLLILANSRPLEGFLLSLPVLVSVAVILVENGKLDWRGTVRTTLPAAALLAGGGCVDALLRLARDRERPGHAIPLKLQNTYHITKPFFFQKPNPVPNYRHQSMRTFYVNQELPGLLISKYSLAGLARFRIADYYAFYLWPFSLAVIPCLYAMCRNNFRLALISLGLVAADILAQVWPPQPHYAAPALGAVFLIIFFSLRYFRNSGSRYTVWGSRAVAMVLALWMFSPIAECLWDPYKLSPVLNPAFAAKTGQVVPMPLEIQRERIQSALEARGGKHLVIVHYRRFDDPGIDWVFNGADVDGSNIIWARDMGYPKNAELLNYYPDRQAWYVEHDDPIAMLLPYNLITDPVRLAFDHSPSRTPVQAAENTLQQRSSPASRPITNAKPQISAILSP